MSGSLWVAPREIKDLILRCCCVRQIDVGVGDLIGTAVQNAHLNGSPALEQFLAACNANTLDGSFVQQVLDMEPGVAAANPYQDGVEVDAAVWTELYRISQDYLVSAILLDGFIG